MIDTQNETYFRALVNAIVEGIQDIKGEDIKLLDLRKLSNRVVDAYVITHAKNDKQVEAIADPVEDKVRKIMKEKPWHQEGRENKEWILMDYVNVAVHIFLKNKREFFAIEDLWGDAEIENFESVEP